MEYVIVVFSEKRRVLMDGADIGETGDTLQVETGTHDFSLSGLHDYRPVHQQLAVHNTNPIIPLDILFVKKGAS